MLGFLPYARQIEGRDIPGAGAFPLLDVAVGEAQFFEMAKSLVTFPSGKPPVQLRIFRRGATVSPSPPWLMGSF